MGATVEGESFSAGMVRALSQLRARLPAGREVLSYVRSAFGANP
jgi:hypothetical protein